MGGFHVIKTESVPFLQRPGKIYFSPDCGEIKCL